MTFIDTEKLFDIPAREILLDRAFGSARFGKTCERLREGRLPAEGLAFAARAGDRLVGTLRFWHVNAGGVPALMLGPLAIDPAFRSMGLGGTMMRHGLHSARELGHAAVILVGDAPYYARFGFDRAHTHHLALPGPVEKSRFLGLNLVPDALAHANGMVRATGAIPMHSLPEAGHRRLAA